MGFPSRLMVSGPESRRVLGELAGDAEAWSKAPGVTGQSCEGKNGGNIGAQFVEMG